MTWLDPTMISGAYQLYKEMIDKKKVRGRLKRFTRLLSHGETQLSVFGAGGTGKTTFQRILTSDNPIFADEEYNPDWTLKTESLAGEIPARLIVAPGQERYVETEWQEMFKILRNKRSLSVVNVVAFGYHSFDLDSFTQTDSYQEGMEKNEFLTRYIKNMRRVELDRLKSLREGLKKVKNPVWMTTIVSKQDIWWNDKILVRGYYTGELQENQKSIEGVGKYASVIAQIGRDFQNRNLGFSHHFISCSQAHSNFSSRAEGLLAATAPGYDLSKHIHFLHNMIYRIDELMTRGQPSSATPK